MKVAIDSGSGGSVATGIGISTRELVSRLQTEANRSKNLQVDFFDFYKNEDKLTSGRYDIVHYPYFHPFFLTLPAKRIAKTVVTIHDLIPLIYPDKYPSGTKGYLRYLIQRYRLKNVDAVLTI